MSSPPQLDAETRAFIARQQEREYRKLSLAMGLGPDPRASYERIRNRTPPPAGEPEVPTPFEDPHQYPATASMLRELLATYAEAGKPIAPAPAVATLPSGEVDAQVVMIPRTGTPIVFFDHGLFYYLEDFAWLIAGALPPVPMPALASDDWLARPARRSFTMPYGAPANFAAALNAYVVSGTPLDKPAPVPREIDNTPLAFLLVDLMQRFTLAHELAHIMLGHLDQPATKEQEHEADMWGMAMVTSEVMKHGSWGLAFWACDLALTALHFLYRAIAISQFGSVKPRWISTTHPDPLTRRDTMRAIWATGQVPAVPVTAARELCGMSDGILGNLWEWTNGLLEIFRAKGARPSPLWQGLIGHTFDGPAEAS